MPDPEGFRKHFGSGTGIDARPYSVYHLIQV